MERVKKGEDYWFIDLNFEVTLSSYGDQREPTDDWLYNCGNYFATEEEAESMAKKLRAVLKGADIIEVDEKELDKLAEKHCEIYEFEPTQRNSTDSGWEYGHTYMQLVDAYKAGYRKSKGGIIMNIEETERTLFKCPTPEHCTRECPYHHPEKAMCMTYWLAKGAKTVLDKLPSEENIAKYTMESAEFYHKDQPKFGISPFFRTFEEGVNQGCKWLKSQLKKKE